MVATAVTFYDVVLFLHILSVVLAFGPTFAYGLFIATAQREGGAAIPAIGRSIVAWDRTAGTAGMVVILLTGIYMAAKDFWSFGDFFISWGFVAIIALFGMVHGYFGPKTREAVALAERDLGDGGELSSEFNTLSAQLARVGSLAGLIVVLTIYVMTAKPFL